MGIKQKIAIMIGIPMLALLLLVGLGWWSLKQLNGSMNHVVNDKFANLIDQDIVPLINEDMLPVINEDLSQLQGLQESIRLILEADRDAHQALIAEQQALTATGEAIEAADATNAENIGQVEDAPGAGGCELQCRRYEDALRRFRQVLRNQEGGHAQSGCAGPEHEQTRRSGCRCRGGTAGLHRDA